MIIKQMRDPKNRLDIAKGNAERSELGDSQGDLDDLNSARSKANESRLHRSTIARIQQKNEESRKRQIAAQRKAYLARMHKEKISIQKNLQQMEELQSVEMRLLDSVQKATLFQQEVKERYDEVVLAKTNSKPNLLTQHNVWLRAPGLGSGAAGAGSEGSEPAVTSRSCCLAALSLEVSSRRSCLHVSLLVLLTLPAAAGRA